MPKDVDSGRFRKDLRAKPAGQSLHQSFVATAKSIQRGTLARSLLILGQPHHSANDAARGFLSLVKLGKRASNAQLFGVPRVHAGNKGARQPLKELVREFSADESSDGFIAFGRGAVSENVTEERPLRGAVKQ